MADISTYLRNIEEATLGEQVRGSIRDAIEAINEAAEEGIEQASARVGTPLTANTVAAMTDASKVYVYTGSEVGYNNGHWYYYNGTNFVDGGIYNSTQAINGLSSLLEKMSNQLNNAKTGSDYSWTLGTLNPGTGAEAPSATRIRSEFIFAPKGSEIILANSTNYFLVYCFDSNYEYISDSAWVPNSIFSVSDDRTSYIRVLLRNQTSSSIPAEDIESMIQDISFRISFLKDSANKINDINRIKEYITDSDVNSLINYTRGDIDSSTGLPVSDTQKVYSDYIDVSTFDNQIYIDLDSSYSIKIVPYNKDYQCISDPYYGAWVSLNSLSIILNPFIKFVIICIRKNSGGRVEYPDVKNILKIYKKVKHNDRAFVNNIWDNAVVGTNLDSFINLSRSPTRLSSVLYPISVVDDVLICKTSEAFKVACYFFDETMNLVSRYFWAQEYMMSIPSNAKWYIVSIAHKDDAVISIEDDPYAYVVKLSYSDFSTVDVSHFELGSLNPGSGAEFDVDTRVRSDYIYVGKGTCLMQKDTDNYRHLYYMFDKDFNYINDVSWSSDWFRIDKDCYIRILLTKRDNASIDAAEIEDIVSNELLYLSVPSVYRSDSDAESSSLPNYYIDPIASAVTKIRKNMFSSGIDGDTFIFITDLHWPANTKHTSKIVKQLIDATEINNVICGGDIIDGGEKYANVNLMIDCITGFRDSYNFFCMFGNHDSNTIHTLGSNEYFSKSEVFAIMQKSSEYKMNYGAPCYYSFINNVTKTVYIMLDSGLEGSPLDASQEEWLRQVLNNIVAGYHIIVFSHICFQPKSGSSWAVGMTKDDLTMTSFMRSVVSILENHNNTSDSTVEAIVGGHVHFDCNFETDGGIPIVLTDTNSRRTFTAISEGSTVADNAIGTINEQCVDIVTISYTAKQIACVRVGRGSDRLIQY